MLVAGASALQHGRLGEAIDAGEQVLAAFPGDLDALYLLGTARLRRGDFEIAVQLLDRVLERAPDAAPVLAERRRAADALGRRVVEHEVCREVLPRLAALIAEPFDRDADGPAHVVLATAIIDANALALARRGAAAIGLTQPTFWRESYPPIRAGVRAPPAAAFAGDPPPIDPHSRAFPLGGFVLFCGVARSPARWWPLCAPTTVGVVVDEFMPCEIVARVRELAGEGLRRVALLYADAAIERQTRLPGRVIGTVA